MSRGDRRLPKEAYSAQAYCALIMAAVLAGTAAATLIGLSMVATRYFGWYLH